MQSSANNPEEEYKSFQIYRVLMMVTALGITEFPALSVIHHNNTQWKFNNPDKSVLLLSCMM
jgi:hypothetical protein